MRAGRCKAGQAPARPPEAGHRPTRGGWRACFERGSVFPCFVATPEFRIIRLHTRCRRDLTDERSREKQRAEKLLEDAAIKLSSVVTDLHGVTGRDIMDRLIAGERNPKALAELARARARRKIAQLERGPGGRGVLHRPSTPRCCIHAGPHRLDHRRDRRADPVIEGLLAPYEEQLQQAESMPGWGRRAAQDVHRRDRHRHEQVPHRRAPGLLGRAHPAGRPVRQRKGKRRQERGNRYLGGISARPPSPPVRPAPARRPLPAAGPPPRQGQSLGRHRQHPAEASTTSCCPAPAPGTRTSAPTTTSASARHPPPDRPPRRRPAPSATRSPSAAAPTRTRGSPANLTRHPHTATRQTRPARTAGCCRAPS